MIVDPLRHFTVLDPTNWKHRIDVVGCGAVGSHIAVQVLKLGLSNVHLWDYDKVSTHNIPNQYFHPSDIGKNKAEAIAEHWGGKAHAEIFEGKKPIKIVFIAVDSMAARKEIIETNVRNQPHTKLAIETRMGLWGGRVYSIDPLNREQTSRWLEGWYPDEETIEEQAEVGTACQVSQTLGTSASIIANIAVIQMLRWWRNSQGENEAKPDFETLLGFDPLDIYTSSP